MNFHRKFNLDQFLIIRVRGFPARDIFSLRALRDGLGQGARVVGAPSSSSSPSASFLQVRVCVGKILKIEMYKRKLRSSGHSVKKRDKFARIYDFCININIK